MDNTLITPANGRFGLIGLPYAQDALEPAISSTTISFHYGKHLKAYADNLSGLVAGTPFEGKNLVEIVRGSEGAVFNNAGQLLNHNLYFTEFRAPREDNRPVGRLAEAIDAQFGSFESFKDEFSKKGTGLFGSGWVWLSSDAEGKLHVTQEPNASNPVLKGLNPLITFDVWEHAYYLDYQNRRPDHIAALWQIIDWDEAEKRFLSK